MTYRQEKRWGSLTGSARKSDSVFLKQDTATTSREPAIAPGRQNYISERFQKRKSLPREEVRQALNLIGNWEEEYRQSTSNDAGRRSASFR
ncbi:hypothetical protein ASF03_19670 [Rhizobium sp. Leaf68]|nr:hypothetical protein ASE62_17935 [Rhizobium sp. Leaf202]KQN80880.1 hypothetical protein ASF03_19670 [Rhizobium sp. Leaf68]